MSPKVAIVGTGWGTRVQVPAFRAAGLEVVALWGRTRAKARAAADAAGVPFASSDLAEVACHPEAELVSITTPPATHCELAVMALEAGKHVVCEKPTALDAGEAERMLAAAGARPELLSLIDHELRFLPNRRRLRGLVREGWVGELLHVEATYFLGGRLDPATPWNWWSDRRQGGGILGAAGSHLIDALRWTTGREVTGVSARLRTLIRRRADAGGVRREVDADEWAALHLELEGGLPGTLLLSAATAGPKTRRLVIAGTAGALWLDGQRLWGRRGRGEPEEHTLAETPLPDGLRDDEWGRGTYNFARALRSALADGDRDALAHAASFDDGRRVQQVLDAAHASHERRRWVAVG